MFRRSDGTAIVSVIVTAILAAVIAALTLGPVPETGAPGSDKAHHLMAFAALAFPLPAVRPRLAPWVVLGVICYGGFIELIQPSLGRQAELGDLAADAAGAVLGAAAGVALGLWRTRT